MTIIPYGGPDLARSFRTVRKNTLQIAEEIPEDRYDFVAAPGVRPVGRMLVHIANVSMLPEDLHRVRRVTTIVGYDFPGFVGRIRAEEAQERTKEEILELLRTKGEDFAAWLETLTPEFLAETYTDHAGNSRTRFEGLLGAKEHEMHHRGQLMLIERMLSIVPHLTRLMEERFPAARG